LGQGYGESAYRGANEGFDHRDLPFLTPNALPLSGDVSRPLERLC